jgi:NhaC family Na+:H+ antiporter
MESMLSTVALIITALSFGGAMETTGMLQVIAGAILRLARNTAGLILSTLFTCISMNIIAPDQYLSIVVPGRMYKDAYARRGLHPKNLSRALEDGGTLSSSLVPWNTGGAYMWATLGVYPLAYLPFAFVNLITPMVSAFYGATGWTIQPLDEEDAEESELNDKVG